MLHRQHKGAITLSKFANDLQVRTWPVFYDAFAFCKLLNEIDASLQKLMMGNQKCDNADDDEDTIPMCRLCFAGDTMSMKW